MINLGKSIAALLARRDELITEIDAVNQALAILHGDSRTPAPASVTTTAAQVAAEPIETPPVTRLKPKRALSDAHLAAMMEGRRKARQAKDIAAGTAIAPVDAPALSAPMNEAPRLVKRRRVTEPAADALGHVAEGTFA